MKDFVYGTDQDYAKLREALKDGLCHVYSNCELPAHCSQTNCRIGFEKAPEAFIVYIDKGIKYTGFRGTALFKEWLSSGTLKFLDFNDVKAFLKSLSCLY